MNINWLRPDLRNLVSKRNSAMTMRLLLLCSELINIDAECIKVTEGTAWVTVGDRDVIAPAGTIVEVGVGNHALVSALGAQQQTTVEVYNPA